jgi:hypothetical protein
MREEVFSNPTYAAMHIDKASKNIQVYYYYYYYYPSSSAAASLYPLGYPYTYSPDKPCP